MQSFLDFDFFLARLHGPVTVGTDSTLELVLSEVQKLTHSQPGRVSFSLLLRGPLAPELEQATYPLSWPGLAPQDIFLVPVGREPDAMLYQAIFN